MNHPFWKIQIWWDDADIFLKLRWTPIELRQNTLYDQWMILVLSAGLWMQYHLIET